MNREHWNTVYRTKAPDRVSWFQPKPEPSLRTLDELRVPTTASLIDVGGGASSLVDHLLDRGWTDLTVLDIAEPALTAAQARLGPAADRVRWEVADVTQWRPSRVYDVWHDRAVFHFLTDPTGREAYRGALGSSVAPGGLVLIATFALDGPERCSGLPVQRYDAAALSRELGAGFSLLRDWREAHTMPGGGQQNFNWCVFHRN